MVGPRVGRTAPSSVDASVVENGCDDSHFSPQWRPRHLQRCGRTPFEPRSNPAKQHQTRVLNSLRPLTFGEIMDVGPWRANEAYRLSRRESEFGRSRAAARRPTVGETAAIAGLEPDEVA